MSADLLHLVLPESLSSLELFFCSVFDCSSLNFPTQSLQRDNDMFPSGPTHFNLDTSPTGIFSAEKTKKGVNCQ